jgi:hypothetical protein
MQGFVYEKMLQANLNYSQDRSFLTENEENPALVLSNVHNKTSAKDAPMFGYKGPSMNTNSLSGACRTGSDNRSDPFHIRICLFFAI